MCLTPFLFTMGCIIFGGVIVARRGQDMKVIGHQHVGMDIAARIAGRRFETSQVKGVIVGFEEAGLWIVATLRDVLWHVDQSDGIRVVA